MTTGDPARAITATGRVDRVATVEVGSDFSGPIDSIVCDLMTRVQAGHRAVAKETLEQRRIRGGAGKTNGRNLVADRRAYQRARIGFVPARGQRLRDGAGLFVALGGGWWKESL